MSIDLKTIKHISKLSRISVDEQKAEKLAGDLNSIFKFIEKLNELNTCLLYTSDAADEQRGVDLGGRRIIKKKKDQGNMNKKNNIKIRQQTVQQ